MNVIRFSDLCAQGKVQGRRVFIRADLNVPQADDLTITDDTRIRAAGSSVGRLATYTSHVELGGSDCLSLANAAPS